jgi:methionine sulfoxide reductase heme-binding subunit
MLAVTSTTVWYTMRATGIVALVLLTGTMVIGILTAGRVKTRSWPAFAQADLHKRVSLLAMAFLAMHVLTAVLDTYVKVGWLAAAVPFASPYRPVWTGLGTAGVDVLVAVAISSALRHHIRPRTWRAIHWLAYASWPVAMAHSLGMGTDASTLWMDAIAATCTLGLAAAVMWRIVHHQRERERALASGSLTRVVPNQRRSGPAPVTTGPGALASSSTTARSAAGESFPVDSFHSALVRNERSPTGSRP